MDQSYKLSVIIPVYNVEQYLARCLDTVLSQSYRNIEVILIDDCSKDDSLVICNKYASQDNRIKVLCNENNAGVSATRNNGLDNMTGDYVCFIDSDDYIMPGMFSEMIRSLIESNSDIAVCHFMTLKKDHGFTHFTNLYPAEKKDYKSIEFERLLVFSHNMYEDGYVCSLWNKIFKKEIFEDIRFEGRYAEDYRIMDLINSKTLRIIPVNTEYYVYCYNQNSITHKNFGKEKWLFLDVLLQRLELYKNEADIVSNTMKKYCDVFLEYYFKSLQNGIVVEKKYIKKFNYFVKSLLVDKSLKLSTKIRYCLFKLNPKIYEMAVRIRQ